jgi:hypothetical protein
MSYTISNGTALAGADYIAQSGAILFPAGTATQTLAIVVNADLEMEPDETFTVHLFAPVNVLFCDEVGVGTILDGTVPPVITVANVVVMEGGGGITNALFPVTLNRASPQTIRLDIFTADGSALAGLDYLAQTGTVVFLPGMTSNTFVVPVLADCSYEATELFFAHLTNAVFAVCATNVATGTILNDDPLPTVFIDGSTVREGDSGVTNAVFHLHLSCPSSLPLALTYATQNGTALAGLDYIATNGTVLFPAGATEATVIVPVLGDLVSEPDETFYVTLQETATAILSTNRAMGLILDDDGVVIDISPAQGVEGGTALFTLTLSKPAGSDVTVNFTTADGTAIALLDYVPTNVVIHFPVGTTNQTQGVALLTDALEEPDETFLVLLSQPVRGTLARDQTFGLIIDDTPPCLTLIDTSITDDGSGDQSVRFPVTLNSPSALTVCVRYHTTNGTAIAGPDYIAADGVLCFAPGETNAEVLVRVLPNTRDETNEFFYLVLTDPTNATLCRGIAAATIINPLVTNAPPIIELGALPACLTLPADLPLTATASDPDGRINRVDFYAGTNLLGTCIEPPYAMTWRNVPSGQHLLTAVALDNVGASATSAPVSLSASYPASISIDDVTVVEGHTGTNATFTLTLSSASCRTVSVDVLTFDGTALADYDYRAVWTNVTFLPGETVKLLPVRVLGDTLLEPDETFLVCMTNQQNVTLARACGVGTIVDDDTNTFPFIALASPGDCLLLPTNLMVVATATDPDGTVDRVEFYDNAAMLGVRTVAPFEFAWMNVPSGQHLLTAVAVDNLGARSTSAPVAFSASFPASLSIDDVTVFESLTGTNAVFTLTLGAPSCRAVSVHVATADGTALAGLDYVAVQTNLIFLPGETAKPFSVPILGDSLLEPDETFFVCLTNQQFATLARACGVGTILNDDTNAFPVITLASPGDCLLLPTNLMLVATASDTDGQVDRVEFYNHAVMLGTKSTPPFGYVWTNVPSGQHLLTAVAVDNLGARSTSAPVAFSASFPASLTINDVTVFESLTGTNAIFTLTLAAPSCRPVSFEAVTRDGTALAGFDYLAVQTNLTFLPGETVKLLSVPILGDSVLEPDETFFVCLTNQLYATLARPCGLGTILNDDTNVFPAIALASPGDCLLLPTNLMLVATASDTDGQVDRVEFYNHTAMLGTKATAPFGFIWTNVPSGQHLLTAVAVDNLGARATSAPVAFSASFPASLTINDVTVFESLTGTNAIFTLTLAVPSCRPVSVHAATVDGTALAGLDYIAVQTNLTFLPGETIKLLSIPILGDSVLEPDETFFVCLTNQQAATLVRGCGLGTILNDDTNAFPAIALASPGDCLMLPTNLILVATVSDADGQVDRVEFYNHATMLGMKSTAPFGFVWTNVPSGQHLLTAVAVDNLGARSTSAPIAFSASFPASLTIDDVTVFESLTGTNAIFTLTLAAPSCRTVSVEAVTRDGTALAGLDYLAVQTNLTFLPGETIKLLSVPILGDSVLEPDETFFVCLTNQQAATLVRGCGLGTILNDDTNAFPAISLASPGDCLLLPTNLTLVATATDADGIVERVEFFDYDVMIGKRLGAPFEFLWSKVTAGQHLLTAVAVDNLGARATSAPVAFSASFPASLSIDDVTVFESLTGTNAVFTLTMASPSCRTVSVEVVTRDGTALAGSDYLALQTNFVFLPGETAKTLAVRVLGDSLIEPDETFFVCMTNQQYATLFRACGLGTILNDDTNAPANLPPTVAIITPTNGAVFTTPPGLVPIEAVAQDSDGIVTRVDFYSGALFLGTDTNAPFTVLWTNNVAGNYTLTAVATDDDDAKGTSAPVSITIRACIGGITATPLQDQTRCVCDEVFFSTTVTSPDPVTYAWFLNGSPLPGETGPTLHLQGLKPEHAGVYTVQITSPCSSASRSAVLTIRGAGNQNPVFFTNAASITLSDNTIANPYPSILEVFCVPGPLKHISVTLDGLSHRFPDDVDVLLVGPGGQSVKLISDCGGNAGNSLTNVVLTFTDTATSPLPDATRIASGIYAPTDYAPTETFPVPAPATAPSASFAPFIGTNPNGIWSLYARDDQSGDAGQLLRGWRMAVEWLDTVPFLTAQRVRPDGSFELTMLGLPHMTHVIEASSNLQNWTPISTNTPQSNTTLFIDPNASASPSRFYRAVRCP